MAAQTPVAGPDLLDLQAGAVILSATGEYNEDWSALNLLDGTTKTGWSAPAGTPAPYAFVIELPRWHRLRSIVLDNTDAKESYPGISARNVQLSAERAQAVRTWLIAREIVAARLEPKGLGESRPVADNATPQGRALNRRVEIVILK